MYIGSQDEPLLESWVTHLLSSAMELDLSVGFPWEARATIRIHKVGLDGLICAKGGPNKCLDNNFMKVSYSGRVLNQS